MANFTLDLIAADINTQLNKMVTVEENATADQDALAVPTNTTNFNNNLSASDVDVQKALDTIDNFALAGNPPAVDVIVDAAGFNKNLSTLDVNAQLAFNTLDQMTLGGSIDHGTLAGLQGGVALEYYHLTAAEHALLLTVEENAAPDQDALGVPTNTLNFTQNLSAADTDVQKALDTLDNLTIVTSVDHNDTGAIQGGVSTERYHFTAAQHTLLLSVQANAAPDQNALAVPTDTTNFNVRLSAADTDVQKALETLDNIPIPDAHASKNLLLNGDFDIWQRGDDLVDVGDYGPDQWLFPATGATGREMAKRNSTITEHKTHGFRSSMRVYNKGASPDARFFQPIEGVWPGRTVTIQFTVWFINADDVVLSIRSVDQTGAFNVNSSAPIAVAAGQWRTFSATIVIPDMPATAIVNDPLCYTLLVVEPQNSADIGARHWANFQMEFGSEATAFEQTQPQKELAKCQRYYVDDSGLRAWYVSDSVVNGDNVTSPIYFPVPMYKEPTVNTVQTGASADIALGGVLVESKNCAHVFYTATATRQNAFAKGQYTADARLPV